MQILISSWSASVASQSREVVIVLVLSCCLKFPHLVAEQNENRPIREWLHNQREWLGVRLSRISTIATMLIASTSPLPSYVVIVFLLGLSASAFVISYSSYHSSFSRVHPEKE